MALQSVECIYASLDWDGGRAGREPSSSLRTNASAARQRESCNASVCTEARKFIFAHFFCGRRERCTFPTAPWPAAASTTSPRPRPLKSTTYRPADLAGSTNFHSTSNRKRAVARVAVAGRSWVSAAPRRRPMWRWTYPIRRSRELFRESPSRRQPGHLPDSRHESKASPRRS